MGYDVLVVGSYSMDLIFTGLPRIPKLGEEVIGSGFEQIPGEAYTPAVAMHRLGLKVGWAGDFGNDEYSQSVLRHVRQEGLDEKLFIYHNRPLRRLSVAASFPIDRFFITYYDPDPTLPAAIKALATVSAKVVYIPGLYYGPMFDAGQKLARLRNMLLVMDGNAGSDDSADNSTTIENPEVARALKSCTVFMPNSREARKMTGESDLSRALQILSRYCPLVVIKDGSNGAFASHDREIIYSPAISVSPLDTTGAGDCFNAGFLTAWLAKKSIKECLQWGNICGGLSTLGYGGSGWKITSEDVQQGLFEYAHHTNKHE